MELIYDLKIKKKGNIIYESAGEFASIEDAVQAVRWKIQKGEAIDGVEIRRNNG